MNPTNAITIAMPVVPTLSEIESLKELGRAAARSNFLNSTASSVDGRAADAFFVIMYGRELGISAMTALKTIFVIDGKPSCSGQAMLALLRRAGVEVEIPNPGALIDEATVRIRRPGGQFREYTYTKDMAVAAGLWDKGTWKKYWRQMLIWRALSDAARYEAPDVIGGLYTIEEIAPDTPFAEDGTPTGEIITGQAARKEAHWIYEQGKHADEWLTKRGLTRKDVADLTGMDIAKYASLDAMKADVEAKLKPPPSAAPQPEKPATEDQPVAVQQPPAAT